MVRVQSRIYVGMEVLQYFTMRNWSFKSERTRALTEDMNERDRRLFFLANEQYDIDEYLKNSVLGARQYCLREPLTTLPNARKHLRWLFMLDCITKAALGVILAWAMIAWVDMSRTVLNFSTTQMHRMPFIKSFVTFK